MIGRAAILAAIVVAGTSAPAQALPFCTDSRTGVVLEFGWRFGAEMTDEEKNEFDRLHLRRMGVDATRVERWNGCIRAFVRHEGGGEHMEFYDPNTFERLQ